MVIGILILVSGILVLLGWQFEVDILKTFGFGAVNLNPNSAALFILSGLTLLIQQFATPIVQWLTRISSALIILAGFLTLIEYVAGLIFGMDILLFDGNDSAGFISHRGRIAAISALNFIFIGLGFFLLSLPGKLKLFRMEAAIVSAFSIGTIGLLGWIFRFNDPTGATDFLQMSIHEAVSFIALSVGLFFTIRKRMAAGITEEQKLLAGFIVSTSIILFMVLLSTSHIKTTHEDIFRIQDSAYNEESKTEESKSAPQQLSTTDEQFKKVKAIIVVSFWIQLLFLTLIFFIIKRDLKIRRKSEMELEQWNGIARIFLTCPDDEMFNEVLKTILDVMQSPFGVFGFIDRNGALNVPTMTRQIWDQCHVPEKTIIFPRESWGDSSWPRAIREKRSNYANKVSDNTPEGHVVITRHLTVPILYQEVVLGLFQVANKETDYSAFDIQTLEKIAEYVSPVLSARMERQWKEEELQQLNEQLEDRVEERTADLSNAFQLNESILEQVKTSEERYRHLADNSPLGILVHEEGKPLYANREARIIFEAGEDEDLSKFNACDLVDPRSLDEVILLMKEIARTGKAHPIAEMKFYTFKGKQIDLEITSQPVLFNQRNAIQTLFYDVTEKVKSRGDLIRQEEIYRMVTELTADVCWEWDSKTHEIKFSDKIHELVKCEPEEVQNTYDFFVGFVHPDDRPDYDSIVDQMLKQGGENFFSTEYRMIRKDGEIIYVEERINVIRDDSEVPVQMVGAISDISPRKKAEEKIRNVNVELNKMVEARTRQLEEAIDEAERANQAKSEFLSRMSHELRTPMNSILGFAQLMEMGELTPVHRKSVNQIRKSGQHLLNLINEVLDLSKIEAGLLTYSIEPVQLGQIIHETIDTVGPLTDQRNISIELTDSSTNRFYVNADRQKLHQVLLNLLSNAIKYNREGGSVKLECTDTKRDGDQGGPSPSVPLPGMEPLTIIRISVKDTGMGIAPEEMDKLFEPFERVGAESTEIEGTGLGLAVAKELIEGMGGKIGVESKIGQGTTFWVELPRVESQLDLHERISSHIKQESGKETIKGTVLYIEDSAANIQLIKVVLENLRPSTFLIAHMFGKDAVKIASEYHPDLILLDLDLPDIHGSEVLRLLIANQATSSIPVVIVSVDASPKQKERLMIDGAKDYLTKPLDVLNFLKVLDGILEPLQSALSNSI